MEIARKAAKDPETPRPIYIIGLIVHNRFAVDELTNLGVTTWMAPTASPFLSALSAGQLSSPPMVSHH